MPNQQNLPDDSQTTQTDSGDLANSPPAFPGSPPDTSPPIPELSDLPPVFSSQGSMSTATDREPKSEDVPNENMTAPPDFPPIVAGSIPKKGMNKKLVATVLGLLILVGGVGSGIALVQQRQLFQQKASEEENISQGNACTGPDGCGYAPVPLPTYNKPPFQVGPFPVAGKVVVYYYGLNSGAKKIYLLDKNSVSSNYDLTTSRIVTGISVNAGDKITLQKVVESDQSGIKCAPKPSGPYEGIGWMSVNSDNTCGSGLNGPPTGGKCTPMEKISVASHLTPTGNDQVVSKQCWADWMEWPGDYDFEDYFIMIAVEPAGPPTATPTSTSTATPTSTPTYPPGTGQCSAVRAYNSNWQRIADFSTLTVGTVVNFAVRGTADVGVFDKARFKINDIQSPTTTAKHFIVEEGTELEYYYQVYTIKETDIGIPITVKAIINNTVLGWSNY